MIVRWGVSRVIVTGCSGKLGRFVVPELQANGYEVLGIDRQRPAESAPSFMQLDLTDLGQVYGALKGAEAVVHLAAIAAPLGVPPELVFRNNVMSTFNVCEAAATLGLKRVVFASTDSTLGFPYASRCLLPEYVPVDEEHPLRPQDPYGLSKVVGEETCRSISRRTGITALALRFTYIAASSDYGERFPRFWEDDRRGPRNLWCYVDGRDAARACRLALEAPVEGFEALYIAAADSYMNVPTRELLEREYPELSDYAPGWGGFGSALSCAKAERLLGWRPEHSWRDEAPG